MSSLMWIFSKSSSQPRWGAWQSTSSWMSPATAASSPCRTGWASTSKTSRWETPSWSYSCSFSHLPSPTCWWKVNFQAQQTCVCVSKNVYLAKLWKTQQKCAQVGDDGSILQLQWVGDLWAWGARNVSVIKPKKQTQEGDADLGWTLGQKTSAMTDVIL